MGLCNNGLKFWGSPATSDFEGWAFGKHRKEMVEHWRYMPKEIDVLITHTPPLGILDQSSEWKSLGCEALLKKVKVINPQYHVFGHIHASYGIFKSDETTFINASSINSYMGPVNAPIVINL